MDTLAVFYDADHWTWERRREDGSVGVATMAFGDQVQARDNAAAANPDVQLIVIERAPEGAPVRDRSTGDLLAANADGKVEPAFVSAPDGPSGEPVFVPNEDRVVLEPVEPEPPLPDGAVPIGQASDVNVTEGFDGR